MSKHVIISLACFCCGPASGGKVRETNDYLLSYAEVALIEIAGDRLAGARHAASGIARSSSAGWVGDGACPRTGMARILPAAVPWQGELARWPGKCVAAACRASPGAVCGREGRMKQR